MSRGLLIVIVMAIAMHALALTPERDTYVTIKPVVRNVTEILPGKQIGLLVTIRSSSERGVTLMIRLEGAYFITENGRMSKVTIEARVSGDRPYTKVFKVYVVSSTVIIDYSYGRWHGKGIIGQTRYPCTFIEVYVSPHTYVKGFSVFGSRSSFVTRMVLEEMTLQQLFMRVYNSCGLTGVPISVEFPNAKPSQKLVVYKCLNPVEESYPVTVCSKWKCQVSDVTGPLKCVKKVKVKEPICICKKWSKGKCVSYKIKYKTWKMCVKYVSTTKCYMYACTNWITVPYSVQYCRWLKSDLVSSTVKVRGNVAGFTLNGAEALASIYYEPNKYYYGPASSSEVVAPIVTVYVGGIPYYTIEGKLEVINYHSLMEAALITLLTFIATLAFFYFT